jgi:cobalamin biosynthesis protein CobD/CbiB
MNVRRTGILCLALLLDLLLGDPPNRIHPVAGMGAAIAAAQRRAPRQGRLARLGYGALLTVGGGASVAGLVSLLSPSQVAAATIASVAENTSDGVVAPLLYYTLGGLAAALAGEDIGNAWQIWRRDASKTASPNAGHPMSTMAGALGVKLEKVGHYQLGAGGCPPASRDIGRAVHLSRMAIALAIGLLAWLTARGRGQ